jgi:hypothetical protein
VKTFKCKLKQDRLGKDISNLKLDFLGRHIYLSMSYLMECRNVCIDDFTILKHAGTGDYELWVTKGDTTHAINIPYNLIICEDECELVEYLKSSIEYVFTH